MFYDSYNAQCFYVFIFISFLFTLLNNMKTVKSTSIRSARSIKSIRSMPGVFEEESIIALDEYMALACKKYIFSQPVLVKKENRRDDYGNTLKLSDPTRRRRMSVAAALAKDDQNLDKDNAVPDSGSPRTSDPEDAIIIHALYDNMKHLAEIRLNKVNRIPRQLIQQIGVIVPYYSNLTKIYITGCGVDANTIYELGKMIRLSSITDICLDGCCFPEANFAILLNAPSPLTSFSLCRCLINDEVCRQIASNLHYMKSDICNLSVLNLSSNHITDVGAKYVAEALRSNRRLRYLNMADNRLTDEGACSIFNTLMEFILTHDETIKKRQRYMDYLKKRRSLCMQYLNEMESKSGDEQIQFSKKSATMRKRKSSATSLKSKGSTRQEKEKQKLPTFSDDCISHRAEMLAAEFIGPFMDPFDHSSIRIKEGCSYCLGNMFLCYLDLSYNNLSYVSIKKLHAVVYYQAMNKRTHQPGLIKVVLDGNNMPEECYEIKKINDVMNKYVACFGGKAYSEYGMRRKSRATRISMIPDKIMMLEKE